MTQHDPTFDHDAQQAREERGEAPTIALTALEIGIVLDWLTFCISQLEGKSLNTAGVFVLMFLKDQQRGLKNSLLAQEGAS